MIARRDPSTIKVLIGCEASGTVRRAFEARGFDAWSCDLRPAADGSNRHITGDVRDVLNDGWDFLGIFHTPCTRLCNSGVRWLSVPPPGRTLADMWRELDEGADLFSTCWNAPIPRKAMENPVMHKHAKARIRNYREFAQSVQPWQYGDFETKRTCLWLDNLAPLRPTYATTSAAALALGLPADAKPVARVHLARPGPDRWLERSQFFPGIAAAMVAQWGDQLLADERIAA